MGSFRTFLAISVVFAHLSLGEKFLVGGQNAVQLFYMVSGFLITFVLNGSYSDTRAFYFNRALRIFPIYWIVATGIALFHWIAHTGFYGVFSKLPASADIFLILSNILIFGQDWVLFFGVKEGALLPVSHFSKSDVPLFYGLVVGPAWTLGVELTFYLIAPFVVRRKIRVFIVFFASILLRVFLFFQGLVSDPWSYRFFPAELALFMAGAIACHYGVAIWPRNAARYAAVAAVILLITYPFWPVEEPWRSACLVFAEFFLLPGLFLFQAGSSLDKEIGELSYPIYICHLPVMQVLPALIPNPHPAITLMVVFVIAILLSKLIGQRLEVIRARVRSASVLKG